MFFHVRSSTHPQPPVSILTFCACVFSRRRASINSLAQKKAAQRRDAKLTQLLAQNDEVRDADFILLPAFKRRARGSQMRGRRQGREEGMEGCACVRDTSEADAADGEVVGVWMDGRGQIRGGRRRR